MFGNISESERSSPESTSAVDYATCWITSIPRRVVLVQSPQTPLTHTNIHYVLEEGDSRTSVRRLAVAPEAGKATSNTSLAALQIAEVKSFSCQIF